MLENKWLVDVLGDLLAFAEANDLGDLVFAIAKAKQAAALEIPGFNARTDNVINSLGKDHHAAKGFSSPRLRTH